MKFLVSALVLISTSAFACPNLAGKYTMCVSSTGQTSGSSDVTVTQEIKGGITHYTVTGTDLENNETSTMTYIADGKTKIESSTDPETGMTMTLKNTTTCIGQTVKIVAIPEIQNQQVGSMTVILSKKDGKMIEQYSGNIFGQTVSDTVICE